MGTNPALVKEGPRKGLQVPGQMKKTSPERYFIPSNPLS